jgi:hypothetical protein
MAYNTQGVHDYRYACENPQHGKSRAALRAVVRCASYVGCSACDFVAGTNSGTRRRIGSQADRCDRGCRRSRRRDHVADRGAPIGSVAARGRQAYGILCRRISMRGGRARRALRCAIDSGIARRVHRIQIAVNIALAPYQAILPDTVPAARLGVASGWMAATQSAGNANGRKGGRRGKLRSHRFLWGTVPIGFGFMLRKQSEPLASKRLLSSRLSIQLPSTCVYVDVVRSARLQQ